MNLRRLLLVLVIALILMPLAVQAEEKKETPASLTGVKVIDVDSLKKWLDSGKDVFILDARKASDFESGHIPDAKLCTVPSDLNVEAEAIAASVEALKKCEALQKTEKDFPIITYCNGHT